MEWMPLNKPPREKGFYVVENTADDGDGMTDVWLATIQWDGRRWCGSTLNAARYNLKRFTYKVSPTDADL
jgi:hypothetical protein